MNQKVLKIALAGLLIAAMFSCKHKADPHTGIEVREETDSTTESVEETDHAPQIPQIITINQSPNRLTKKGETYTVTLITAGKKEDTEFSFDGKDWQKSSEFTNVNCGKYTFYARNKHDKSLQCQKEMYFECFVDVPLPTIPQLNELLKQIADCDDTASDELRKFGKNLPVHGVSNISNIEQLVRDACMNGVIYVVQTIETDTTGNLTTLIIHNS